MSEDTLYRVEVDVIGGDRMRLISITGARETVLDAALRVILDCAPVWTEQRYWTTPMFGVNCYRIERRA